MAHLSGCASKLPAAGGRLILLRHPRRRSCRRLLPLGGPVQHSSYTQSSSMTRQGGGGSVPAPERGRPREELPRRRRRIQMRRSAGRRGGWVGTVALRFRKSVRIGKLARINISKSGLGASMGVPGFRIGMGADGKVRRTVGIPGTGVYHTEVIASPKKDTTKPKRTCQACGRQAGQKDRFCRYCGARLAT